jgi:hypothetical protein
MPTNMARIASNRLDCRRILSRRQVVGRMIFKSAARLNEGTSMADLKELAGAICAIIRADAAPAPVTLMNHSVDEAAVIIGAVVEQCGQEDIPLLRIYINPQLGRELGLENGRVLEHGSRPTICWDSRLGRSLRFEAR